LHLLGAFVFNFERLDISRDLVRHPSKKLMLSSFLGASIFNFARLNILCDSIRHPNKNLFRFEFGRNLRIQFRASRYITGLNRKSE